MHRSLTEKFTTTYIWPLLVAGDGEDKDVLERIADEHHIADRVQFLGWVDDERKRSLIQGCMAMCLPSRTEGLCVAAMEAMAMSKPVIGSNIPGIYEVVDHDVSGLLFPPGDSDVCASAIRRITSEPGLQNRLAAGAHRRGQDLGVDRVVRRKAQFFAEVIASHRARRTAT